LRHGGLSARNTLELAHWQLLQMTVKQPLTVSLVLISISDTAKQQEKECSMKIFLLSILALFATQTAVAGHHEKKSNVEIIDKFFATVFADPAAAKSLLHEDFSFQFMGICTICKSYDKDTYISDWLGKDIPAVLPNGVELDIVRKIDGGDDIVYIVKGKAEGINGPYNNNYAMVFKMLDGQILDFQEYHSDLLAETRLHKKAVFDL